MGTYTNFLAQVRRDLQEPVAGVWYDDSILYWANDAIKDISRRSSPDEDEEYATCVVGQALYDLPAGTTKVLSVFYDGDPLVRTTYSDFTNLDSWSQQGTPRYYLMDEESIRLIPIPDAEKEIRFFRQHYADAITASSNMPWASAYDAAIEYYVLRRAMEQVDDFNSANEYAARYADEVSKIESQEIRERNANMVSAPREVW